MILSHLSTVMLRPGGSVAVTVSIYPLPWLRITVIIFVNVICFCSSHSFYVTFIAWKWIKRACLQLKNRILITAETSHLTLHSIQLSHVTFSPPHNFDGTHTTATTVRHILCRNHMTVGGFYVHSCEKEYAKPRTAQKICLFCRIKAVETKASRIISIFDAIDRRPAHGKHVGNSK